MVEEKDIKLRSVFQVERKDLVNITQPSFVNKIDPNKEYVRFAVEVIDVVNGRCKIRPKGFSDSFDTDIKKLANVACYSVEGMYHYNKPEQVSHPSHYSWLKDLCGVEPLDICRHFDFAIGSALKYLMRKGKSENSLTEKEQRVQDLKKAVFYINDEIKRLENGKG